MPTVSEILTYCPAACVLAGNDIAKSCLTGKRLDMQLANKIYVTYSIINKIYQKDNTYAGLIGATNYLWELMGKYGVRAENYQAESTTSYVPPIPVSAEVKPYLIPVVGSQFTDATHYDNPDIVGKRLAIYWNDISRYLFANEFELTSTGVNITAVGFDALNSPTYELFIYIINPA